MKYIPKDFKKISLAPSYSSFLRGLVGLEARSETRVFPTDVPAECQHDIRYQHFVAKMNAIYMTKIIPRDSASTWAHPKAFLALYQELINILQIPITDLM